MRTDILDLYDFYCTPLGRMAQEVVGARLTETWRDGARLSIAGFGYANPYLELFTGAARRLALAPAAQGVVAWPTASALNSAGLVAERAWPLPDASLDRVLIVHGLEETPSPQKLMREAWRTLADDGRLIIIAAHRRGLWSIVDTTPFAAGRPYLKHQLNSLLETNLFRATAWSRALFFPPFRSKTLLRAARAWERAGDRLWPGLSGVLMVEAVKDMMAPAGLVRRRVVERRRALAAPALARPDAAPRKIRRRIPGELYERPWMKD